MNFEEAFEHVKSGNATAEEQEYIEKELANLRKIRNILDNPVQEDVINKADMQTVIQARKSYSKKTTLKIIAIVLICLLVIAAIVCGIIFIPSCTSAARNQVVTEPEAIELAKDYLRNMGVDVERLYIEDVDRELRIPSTLNNAIYVYEITFEGHHEEYTLEVSTKSGYVIITDIDD